MWLKSKLHEDPKLDLYRGLYGKAVSFDFDFSYHKPSNEWKHTRSLLLDHLNHEVDLVNFLFGIQGFDAWKLQDGFDHYEVVGKRDDGMVFHFRGTRRLAAHTYPEWCRYNFVTYELFVAELGKGATRNGERIHVSERPLDQAYISVETDLRTPRSIKAYTTIRERCIVVSTISCGYEYGLIAQGKLEGRVCFDPFGCDWDYGPGSLLVTEAGGRVTNIGSTTYGHCNHNFIAANVPVHRELSRQDSELAGYW